MDRKKTNIKERVLQIAKNQNISYETFFKDLGISYSNFKGKQKESSLQSDAIDKILTRYPDVDLQWLITGKESVQVETYAKTEEPTANYAIGKFENLAIDKKLNTIYKELQLIKENIIINKEEIAKVELANFTNNLELTKKIKELKSGGLTKIKREA